MKHLFHVTVCPNKFKLYAWHTTLYILDCICRRFSLEVKTLWESCFFFWSSINRKQTISIKWFILIDQEQRQISLDDEIHLIEFKHKVQFIWRFISMVNQPPSKASYQQATNPSIQLIVSHQPESGIVVNRLSQDSWRTMELLYDFVYSDVCLVPFCIDLLFRIQLIIIRIVIECLHEWEDCINDIINSWFFLSFLIKKEREFFLKTE
jgi:hypothetical protein